MMADYGVISPLEQRDQAVQEPLGVDVHRSELEQDWNYFTEFVRQYLVERYGWSAVYEQGLVVYTTLDPDMQAAAEWARRQRSDNEGDRCGIPCTAVAA